LAFDDAHEIADSVDLIRNDVCHRKGRHLILNGEYYFEAIKPVGSEVVAEVRFVRHPRRIDAEMSGYDLADLAADIALHGSLLVFRRRETESAKAVFRERLRAATKNHYVRYLTEPLRRPLSGEETRTEGL
jgi:hypothetical protein